MSVFDPLRTLANSVMLRRMKALFRASPWIFAISTISSGNHAAAAGTDPKMMKPTTCPTNIALAKLVSESDLIVVAAPDVPIRLMQTAIRDGSPDYIDVPVREVSVLKGADAGANLTVRDYTGKTTYMPSPEALLAHTGKPSLLFLTRVDQGPVGVYLTHSLDALQDASPTRVEAVKTEVQRQQVLSAAPPPDALLPHFKDVHDFLSALPQATPDQQKEIFRKLEALGDEGVPAMIAQMDDRRALAVPQITLVNNNPNAFEGLRHYGPELVVDALDAILNQITGFGGFVVNGGSERERQAAVAAWRVYASDIGCR
jgi:hypothetical protein